MDGPKVEVNNRPHFNVNATARPLVQNKSTRRLFDTSSLQESTVLVWYSAAILSPEPLPPGRVCQRLPGLPVVVGAGAVRRPRGRHAGHPGCGPGRVCDHRRPPGPLVLAARQPQAVR